MGKISAIFALVLGVVLGVVLILPTEVSARRIGDNPNSGFCASGQRARDVRTCRENREKQKKPSAMPTKAKKK